MLLLQTISMDFSQHGIPPIVHGKQDDSGSRAVEILLYDRGVAFDIPGTVELMLRYRTQAGAIGLYDAMPDGESAFEVSGNSVVVRMVDQIFQLPGTVECELRIIDSRSGISTWTFLVQVEACAHGDATLPTDYINLITNLSARAVAAAERAEAAAGSVDMSGKADKVKNATDGNFASLDASGNLKDSGRNPGSANGIATLDRTGKVPTNQLPAMDFIPTSQRGNPNGVATLDATGKVPSSQISPASATSGVLTVASNSSYVTITKNNSKWYRYGDVVFLALEFNSTASDGAYWGNFSISGQPVRRSDPAGIVIGGFCDMAQNSVGYAAKLSEARYSASSALLTIRRADGGNPSSGSEIKVTGSVMYMV